MCYVCGCGSTATIKTASTHSPSAWHCVAVCYSALQSVAVCCSLLYYTRHVYIRLLPYLFSSTYVSFHVHTSLFMHTRFFSSLFSCTYLFLMCIRLFATLFSCTYLSCHVSFDVHMSHVSFDVHMSLSVPLFMCFSCVWVCFHVYTSLFIHVYAYVVTAAAMTTLPQHGNHDDTH